MKCIVTHIGPDLDAIAAIWLIKLFLPGWEEAGVAFVPAGKTLDGKDPDSNPEIIHVDTGFGKYDHHQYDKDTCAAKLVWDHIKKSHGPDAAMERLLEVVNDTDHFREVFYPNANADFYDLGLPAVIDGWRVLFSDNPIKIVTLVMESLDGSYKMLQNKVWAEKEIKEHAEVFATKWGNACGVETINDEVVHYGQKMGYVLVIRKDPKKKYVRIKAVPKPDIDLTGIYEALQNQDPDATWFLHASHHMILNGSTKNPDMKPTTLTLKQIIETINNA